MSCNQQSGHYVDQDANWQAYDALPPVLKRAAQQAVNRFNCVQMHLDFLEYGSAGLSGRDACIRIIRGMARRDRETTCEVWGPDHPEARP